MRYPSQTRAGAAADIHIRAQLWAQLWHAIPIAELEKHNYCLIFTVKAMITVTSLRQISLYTPVR